MLRMAGTAIAVASTSTLAVVLSRSNLASAALLLVLGALSGMLLANGPSAAQLGVAATAAALVLGHQVQRPGVALHVGLLVLAGGLAQTVLAVSAWPLGRHRPERHALARLYSALAQLARQPVGEQVGPPLGETLPWCAALSTGLAMITDPASRRTGCCWTKVSGSGGS